MERPKAVLVGTIVVVSLAVSPSCAGDGRTVVSSDETRSPAGSPSPSTPPSPSASPSPSPSPSSTVAASIELGVGGLVGFSFGDRMTAVLPALTELLGPPVEDVRMHGDMPMGWGGEGSTVRLVDFGGLLAVFDDWEGYFRDDGVMHLVSWGADARRTSNGVRVSTTKGISVGASVAELEEAFGSALHLPDVDEPGCAGPPWYFAVAPERPWGLIGSLSAPPDDPEAHVQGMGAGASREGWIPCWEE